MKINYMIPFLLLLFVSFINAQFPSQNDQINKPNQYSRLSFSAVGDIMCHSTQFNYAKVAKDTFNFNPVFGLIRSQLVDPDFTMGNLETVIANKGDKYTGYPVFNTPPDLLAALSNSGFDLLLTSNNHILDQGTKGIKRTLNQIESYGINYAGAYKTYSDADSVRIFEKNNIRFAVLSFTYSLNGYSLPNNSKFMADTISNSHVKYRIEQAEKLDPDIVIVYFHFGDEYETKPSPYQIDAVKNAVKCGADIIIASHPHVLQPIKFFESKSGRIDTGFVAYSLGNFISNQRWRYSDCGAILNFELKKDMLNDSLSISDVSVMPFWVYKGEINNKNEYIILPSEMAYWDWQPEYLSKNDLNLMKESYEDSKEILFAETDKVSLKKFDKKWIENLIYVRIK